MIRNLNLQNTIIVGHSFGAGATVEAVMQNPSLFKGMVLISGALALAGGWSGLFARASAPALGDA